LAFPVQVEPVLVRQVEYAIDAVGSLEAFEQVQVSARVAGAVERVRFAEGDKVSKGTTLVEIDPDRYRVAVGSARAVLEKAAAAEADARATFERRNTLNARNAGLIGQEELESCRNKARAAAAEVALAQSALELAELNLRDAIVRAPMAGVIQTRTVQSGQYVQPGAVLATLVRRDPLLLKLEVPETEAANVRVGMTVRFSAGGIEGLQATVNHVAASASTASRMVEVVAHVAEADAAGLRPGAFAQARIPIGEPRQSPVVPQTAVRPSEKGFLAYVIEDGTALERVLELGLRAPGGLVEIRKGLAVGELLVVRGAEPLKEGAKVAVEGTGGSAPEAQKAPR
jgi:multidrug efflux system membrane fusion protein